MVLHAVARFGELWRGSNRSKSRISQRGAHSVSDARTFPLAPGLLLYVPVSLLGNLIGLVLRYPDVGTAVLFPPYAALTAALVVSSRRHWVWYILVGSATHFVLSWPQWSASWVLLADVANVTRAVVAAVLLRQVFAGPPRLDDLHVLGGLVVSAALIAPAIGATIGATNAVLHVGPTSYGRMWSAWFLSNSLTSLTILPAFLLALATHAGLRWPPMSRRRAAEVLAIVGTLTATTAWAFLIPTAGFGPLTLHFYAPLPVLIWTALRFGSGGATAALTAVTLAAIVGADRGIAPFLEYEPDENVLALQVFVLLTALPVLCIAAISTSRQRTVQLYHALLASAQDHIAILDLDGVVVEANDSWRRFVQRPDVPPFHRAAIGQNFVAAARIAATDGNDDAARVFAGVTSVLDGQQKRVEIEFDHYGGGAHERYALYIEPLARADGGAILRRSNVTARHMARVEIEEQRRQLSHLARVSMLGQLSGALAHELNQPLAAIASNADAARRLLARAPVDVAELDAIVTDIVAANQRAAQVIRRLRALLNRGETRLQPLDTAELVEEVLDLAHAELITRRVTATGVVAPNLPPVLGDRVQLQQVLLNLVLNACEAMSSCIPPDRRLSLTVAPDAGGNIRFSVRDCGSGIPSHLIDRLFEPFVTTKPEGLGLGLSISRTIVAAHGGRLWAQNNTDRGATVHCLLMGATVAQEQTDALGNGSGHQSRVAHV
jgi:two-component system, LuxR family, sensor kinase FixL